MMGSLTAQEPSVVLPQRKPPSAGPLGSTLHAASSGSASRSAAESRMMRVMVSLRMDVDGIARFFDRSDAPRCLPHLPSRNHGSKRLTIPEYEEKGPASSRMPAPFRLLFPVPLFVRQHPVLLD